MPLPLHPFIVSSQTHTHTVPAVCLFAYSISHATFFTLPTVSQEAAAEARERQTEDLRRQIVEEERQRLLEQHATKLLGYLPKGVFQSEGEAAQLGGDFAQTYTRRQRDEGDPSLY